MSFVKSRRARRGLDIEPVNVYGELMEEIRNQEQLGNGLSIGQRTMVEDMEVWTVFDEDGVALANAQNKDDALTLAAFHAREQTR